MDENVTLAGLLAPAKVSDAVLHERYGALLQLVRRLLGVDPKSSGYLEIWPPGFRSYNLLVPNFLNLPFSVFGFGIPAATLGLAMYSSSRAAQCMYCSAHSCSFAMRRGVSSDDIARAVGKGDGLSDAEAAVVTVTTGMATVPPTLSSEDVAGLREHFSAGDAEWIAGAAAMMGYLNKAMDMLGVELEQAVHDSVSGVIGPSGWSTGRHRVEADAMPTIPMGVDSFRRKLSWVPYLPAALRLDKRWSAGVPEDAAKARALLAEHSGHDFPILSELRHGRVIKSLTTMLRDALVPEDSVAGLSTKLLAGLVYATHVDTPALVTASREMSRAAGVSSEVLDAVAAYAAAPFDADDDISLDAAMQTLADIEALDDAARAALLLARGGSPSPAQLSPKLLARFEGRLAPPATIEIVLWLAVLQILQRFHVYFGRAR